MANKTSPQIWNLILRYKQYLIVGLLIALTAIGLCLLIYATFDFELPENKAWEKLADFLMTFGETVLGAGLIGGGIGASINFILEELKKEEEAEKELKKEAQEKREKRKLFRKTMRKKLQHAHDEVELARILIKSHKSGKTYGEQIRDRIMPTLISLVEFKRSLMEIEDQQLQTNLAYLKVSLRYMIAYLSVLVEEFEGGYLEISNLQNYQDTLAGRMRNLFMDVLEDEMESSKSLKKKQKMLKKAESKFGKTTIPSNIEVVWEAMKDLDYIRDFMDELRNEEGERSLYNRYFLQHYFHCKKLLKSRGNSVNEKFLTKKYFLANLEELIRIEEKEKNDRPLTKQDSLTRHIMEKELNFNFKTDKMKKKK